VQKVSITEFDLENFHISAIGYAVHCILLVMYCLL